MRAHHDEGDPARLVRAVDPLVVGAALDDELARLDGLLLAPVERQHDLARHDDAVVEALCAVHGHAVPRREVGDAEQRAARRAARELLGRRRGSTSRVVIGHGHGPLRVKGREGALVRAEGGEGLDGLVAAEDGGAVRGVAGDDEAGVGGLGHGC